MAKMTKAEMAKIVAPTLIEIQLNKVHEAGEETPVNRCQWVLEHQNIVCTIPVNDTYHYKIGYLVDFDVEDPSVLMVYNYQINRQRIIIGNYPETTTTTVGYNAYRYPGYRGNNKWYLSVNLYKNDELIAVWLEPKQTLNPSIYYTTDAVYHYNSGSGYFHDGEEITMDEYYQGQYSSEPHEDTYTVVYSKWQNVRYSGGFGAGFNGWNISTTSSGYNTYSYDLPYPPSMKITGSGGGAIVWDEYAYTKNDAVSYTLPGTLSLTEANKYQTFSVSPTTAQLGPSGGYNWYVWLAVPYHELREDLLAIYKYIFDNSTSRTSKLVIEPLMLEPEEEQNA